MSIDPTGKPDLFPIHIWKYVRDDDRSNVANRWGKFTEQRLQEILLSLSMHLDICKERPNQHPYVEAMVYANIDGLFHPNEDNPPKLKGYQMRIHTTTDIPQKTLGQQTFNGIERAFLRVKQELLMLYSQVEPSESAYKAPLMLVQYKQRVRGTWR